MDEIESLNLDDLDVEELEERLELAAAAPVNCTSYSGCEVNGGGSGGGGGCSWD